MQHGKKEKEMKVLALTLALALSSSVAFAAPSYTKAEEEYNGKVQEVIKEPVTAISSVEELVVRHKRLLEAIVIYQAEADAIKVKIKAVYDAAGITALDSKYGSSLGGK